MAISHLSSEIKQAVISLKAELNAQGVKKNCLDTINEKLNLELTKDDLYWITKSSNIHIRQDQLLDRKINKIHQQLQDKDYWIEGFQDFLSSVKFPEPKASKYKLYTNKGEIIVYISDIHWGNGNTKEIDSDFDSITQWIQSQQMDVHVIFGGDLGESFIPGGMHPGQEIKQDIKGFDLWIHIANKIYEMGEKLSDRNVKMYGIGGNHGRLSKDTFGDLERTAELMVYELARERLSNIGVPFIYFREKTTTFQIGKLHFILNHGDIGFDKLDIERLGWEYGKKGQYNIILHGDKHTGRFKMAEGICLVSCPALAGDGDYNKTLSLYSDKGFVSIIPYGDKAQISFNIL